MSATATAGDGQRGPEHAGHRGTDDRGAEHDDGVQAQGRAREPDEDDGLHDVLHDEDDDEHDDRRARCRWSPSAISVAKAPDTMAPR